MYFDPQVIAGPLQFSSLGTYSSPEELELADVRQMIEAYPLEDEPEVFGLHSNANITFQMKTVKEFMETMLNISPRQAEAKGAGQSPDDICLAMAANFEKQIQQPLNFTPSDTPISLEIFRNQEIERFNILIKVMKTSLGTLQKAIKGLVVMSADLEYMYFSFLNGQCPENWTKVAYPSLKPLTSWFADFLLRYDFYLQWIEALEQKSFWISGLFFPQGFMTAVM